MRRVEGYLYPDTYQFYVGRSAVAALDSMLSNFNSRVYSNGELTPLFEEAAARGYDFSDIITIASLIEEETDGTDRDKIASVIYNRLERPGETGGLLQIDAAWSIAPGGPSPRRTTPPWTAPTTSTSTPVCRLRPSPTRACPPSPPLSSPPRPIITTMFLARTASMCSARPCPSTSRT